jgi:N-acyl-D-aspartate/D-glutamate deacylase
MRIALAVVFLAFLMSVAAFPQGPQAFDVVIEGGRIVDGTGNPWYLADVGIRDGVIAKIGDLSGTTRERTILAHRMVVAPGFIDMLVGSSIPLLLDPQAADSKLLQGVTTIVVGEGDSMAPQDEQTLKDFPASDQLPAWHTFTEYFQLLEKAGIAVNVVHNVGATQVRRIVVGDANGQPSADQLDRMKALVDESMRQGAVGLSSALIYPPGAYARTSELVELAKTAAGHHGVYFTHIRNEGRELLPSVEEAIQIGREAHIPVHIYHLKAAGQENWSLFGAALKLIEKARDSGVDVTADIYPYVRNGIPLTSFLPPKYFGDGSDAILDRLSNTETRDRARHEMETASDWENWYMHAGKDWSNVLIAEVPTGLDRAYEGKSVTQVSKLRHEDPWETFFFLLHSGRGDINVDPLTMDERQKGAALKEPFVCIASDSAPTNLKKATTAHPRTFGTFPRIFAKYVREDRSLSLESAVRAMSSLPANILQLTDRGRIAVGMAADIVIFDPSLVQDVSTFEQPLAYPKGIAYVLVNGRVAVDAGQVTGLRAGRVLRHTP